MKIPRNLHIWVVMAVAAVLLVALLLNTATQAPKNTQPQTDETTDAPADPAALQTEINRQNDAAAAREKELQEKEDELERMRREMEEHERNRQNGSEGEQPQISEKELERREAAAVSPLVALRGQNTLIPGLSGGLQLASQSGQPGGGDSSFEDRYQAIRAALGEKPTDERSANEKWLARMEETEELKPIVPTASRPGVVVYEGTTIRAVLLSRIDSDLPGMITARVLNDVYDTQTQRTLAIPAGSRLIGRYNSATTLGQHRILAAFHRIILPDGRSLMLKTAQGVGDQGASGMPGEVNNHFLETLGSQLLVAALAWVADPSSGSSSTTINISGGSSSSAGQILTNVADKLAGPYANMKPTIEIEPGTTFNVLVNRDILLSLGGS